MQQTLFEYLLVYFLNKRFMNNQRLSPLELAQNFRKILQKLIEQRTLMKFKEKYLDNLFVFKQDDVREVILVKLSLLLYLAHSE